MQSGVNAFLVACKFGHSDIATDLHLANPTLLSTHAWILRGKGRKQSGDSALQFASCYGHEGTVKWILSTMGGAIQCAHCQLVL